MLNRSTGNKGSEFATLLRINPFFKGLDASIIERLASLCSTRHLDSGEMLFQKGDPGDALFGVRRGQIRIESGTREGNRITLNALGAGDLFGEVALLDGEPRTADAVAVEATELFMLRREPVIQYIEQEPKVAVKFIELLCKRLRYISAQMEQSLTLKIGTRIARRLIALGDDFGSEVQITQDQLAAYVGSARESVNRQLSEWQRAGIIDVKRGRILLRDIDALTVEAGAQAER